MNALEALVNGRRSGGHFELEELGLFIDDLSDIHTATLARDDEGNNGAVEKRPLSKFMHSLYVSAYGLPAIAKKQVEALVTCVVLHVSLQQHATSGARTQTKRYKPVAGKAAPLCRCRFGSSVFI